MYSTDHNEILHTSRQCNCRDVCKISLLLVKHILISLVGRAPDNGLLPVWDQAESEPMLTY